MNRLDPQAVVFDLDGTIIDSEPWHKAAEVQVFAMLGVPVTSEELLPFKGRILPDLLNEVRKLKGGREITPAEFIEAERPILGRMIAEQMVAFPDAVALIQHLRQLEMPLAIATSSPIWYLELVWNQFPFLPESFPIVIHGDLVEHGKPHPEPFLRACAALGMEPSDGVAFEDSLNGARSATSAGLHTIGVDREKANHLAGVAHEVVSDLWSLGERFSRAAR